MLTWLYGRTSEPALLMRSLMPEYLPREHEQYVVQLQNALKTPEIRNIALSGSYGVGKSSILRRLAELNPKEVIELSLSTLAPVEPSQEDGLPKQATTPTNQIQREIVKQLLYRETPRKTPNSRFRRIERFQWSRELTLALIVGVAFVLVFLLTGWTAAIYEVFSQGVVGATLQHVSLLIAGFLLTLFLRSAYFGSVNIKEVTAGAATITLDAASVSYFDQYLDEIVYFFEVTKRRIVIFEDIDRFNDSHIFETLRSLNSLLNCSPQIDGPVRFIYAVRDSIFDRSDIERQGRKFSGDIEGGLDAAQAETIRANRTKFFDLIIPVVPFITHKSARNLTAQLLGEIPHSIDPELVDLASRYVPDMRLLKNIRNEFIIFRHRILSGDGQALQLSESELFAMMLYKSTHLADFEAIRFGKSKLDQLYEKSREVVSSNMRRIGGEVMALQRQLTDGKAFSDRCRAMGDRLIKHAKLTANAVDFVYSGSYEFNGQALTEDELRSTDFWNQIVKDGSDNLFLLRKNTYGQVVHKLKFSRSDLMQLLGPFDGAGWQKADTKKNLEAQSKLRAKLRQLKSADIKYLMANSEFTIDAEPSGVSLNSFALSLLGQGLAHQLLRSGYINRNFTLYSATFHGDRVSTAATNFIIHHLERDSPDENFELTASDVDAIIRECPSQIGDAALYNIDFLDHVLRTAEHKAVASTMVASLAQFGVEQKNFLQTYLSRGVQAEVLASQLVRVVPEFIAYLVRDVQLEESKRLRLVDVALSHVADSTYNDVDQSVAAYFASNYEDLRTATSSPGPASPEVIAGLLERANLKLPAIRPLSESMRQAVIDSNLYEVNAANLELAVGSNELLPLDAMRSSKRPVFDYVIEDLEPYLDSIEGRFPSVLRSESLPSIIAAAGSSDEQVIGRLVRLAAGGCVVLDITKVPVERWPVLASNQRIKATTANVSAYLKEFDELDAGLAELLQQPGALSEPQEVGEDDRIRIAFAILKAKDLLTPSDRAELCETLNLEDYLESTEIAPEEGELFALLVDLNVVADDATTYSRLSGLSWMTKERYVTRSRKFDSYMSPELINSDLASLLQSDAIPASIRELVLSRASAFAEKTDSDGLFQLGALAAESGVKIEIGLVAKLAKEGLDAPRVLRLLERHLQEISTQQVSEILLELGEGYAEVATVGRDRPKIPNSTEVIPVLDFLVSHDVVNSYTSEGDYIRINKKHK